MHAIPMLLAGFLAAGPAGPVVARAVPGAGGAAEEEAVPLAAADLDPGAVRISGSFVGSIAYQSRVQLVPEFAGGVPVGAEAGRVDAGFDQFTLGAFKTFAPWLSAGASIEVERHAHRHAHGLDPEFGCPGAGPCVEQFGAEEAETEVGLHRFQVTAIAPVGNGLSVSLGRFDVPFGFERHDAALNLTASISELQRFGRPQSMTGLQAVYPVTPWLDVSAWLVNRWESETTEDPPEDDNDAKSFGGRVGVTPLQASQLLNVGLGGWSGKERSEGGGRRWLAVADVTWSPLASLLLAAEVAYGGEAGLSFRRRGAPIEAPAVSDRDARWLGAYAFAHWDVLEWLGLTARYGVFHDRDGARTGVEQVLQSVTIAPVLHLSALAGASPPTLAFTRTRHPIHWLDVRLEYRLDRSSDPVFSDAEPGTPILAADRTGHHLTLQTVVSF